MQQRAFNMGDGDAVRAPDIAAFEIPVQNGLKGAFLFGEGAEWMLENWGDGAAATVIGAPTIRNGYVTFDGANCIQTLCDETLAATLVVVGRRSGEGSVGFLGNYGGGSQYGVALYSSSGSTTISSSSGREGVGGSGGAGASSNTAQWGIYVLAVPETGQTRIDAPTVGGANNGGSGKRTLTGLGKLRIGGGPSPSFVGANDQLLCLIFDRDVTAAERLDLIRWARGYAASKGITI